MPIERIPVDPTRGRAEWLALRQEDITASVAGALLGVHPYTTAYALWALKSGRISEDAEETAPMRRGRLLEPVAVAMLREDRPDWVIDNYPVGYYFRDPVARIGATPDLLVQSNEGLGVVQFKTVEPSVFRRDWRDEDGQVTPPLWIVIQAIIEAHLTGAKWAAVAPMVVSFGIEMPVIPVPIHAGIFDRIKMEVAAFWRAVADGQAPDPDFRRDAALLEKMFDPTTETVDLSVDNALPSLADERARLSAEKSAADRRLKEIKAELLHKLGQAHVGRLADGRIITAKRISRAGYQVNPTTYVDVRVKGDAA